jgi:tRNA(Ile)-lysidine synthase
LQAYLQSVGQAWREDASNLDPHFARNRVRHKVLPLLQEELNPRIRELLAETAAIARAEEEYWAAEVSRMLPQVWSAPGTGAQPYLQIDALCRLPLALQRRLVRAAAESMGLSLAFQHVEELLEQAQAPPVGEKQIVLPGGSRVLRHKDRLQFEPPECGQALKKKDFAYRLASPGEVAVAETGTIFRAIVRPISPEHAGQAYDPARLEGPLQVRNWRPGDRFWPGHTRAAKKIKELLQERKITPAQRRTWPVVTMGASGREQVIWLRGFPPPQQWLAVSGQEHGLIIEECALQEAWHGAE